MSKPIYVFQSRVTNEAKRAVNTVMDSGWIGLGNVTNKFESKVENYLGVKANRVVGLNSATSALHLALLMSGIHISEVVLTTAMTFVSTNHAILYCGGVPHFIDINKHLSIDMDNLDKTLEQYYGDDYPIKAVMLVHYGGCPIPKYDILRLMNKYQNTRFIQDCSHAFGAKFEDGSMVGSFGDYCIFSLHAVKNLASPDGGLLVVNNKDEYDKLMKLRWMGIDKDTITRTDGGYGWYYNVVNLGYKYHMNDMCAAMSLCHLKVLDEDNDRRRFIIGKYHAAFRSEGLKILMPKSTCVSSGHMAVLFLYHGCTDELRNKVISIMKSEHNVHPGVHYTPNTHFAMYREEKKKLPNTNKLYGRIITLPCHMLMDDEDIGRVINSVLDAVGKVFHNADKN